MAATITTREEKGSPLTTQEVDTNFTSLDEYIQEVDQKIEPLANDIALVLSIALG